MYQSWGVAMRGNRACRYIRLSSTARCSVPAASPVRAASAGEVLRVGTVVLTSVSPKAFVNARAFHL
jgi:hypothetical protein